MHRGIIRKGAADFREWVIEREIVSDNLRGRAGKEKPASTLLHVNAGRADRPRIAVAAFFPMKDLAGIERAREIEIRRRDFH